MFGQNNNQADPAQTASDNTGHAAPVDQAVQDLNIGALPSDPTPPTPSDNSWQHPGTPLDNPAADADHIKDVISPAGGYPSSPNDRITPGGESEPVPEPVIIPEPIVSYTPDTPSAEATDSSGLVTDDDVSDAELIEIKKKALSELIPLIDKLDQPPQEKFRTIMMMIQASDDQRLVEKAYESAHAIEDEEARAQALLDIVNEINYFTQQPETTEAAV